MCLANSYEVVPYSDVKLYYYKKKMETKSDIVYYSHVFFTDPMSNSMLEAQWKKITSFVAIRYQSEIDMLIERSNFYICFVVNFDIDNELRGIIEGNAFCARKFVFTINPYDEIYAIESINKRLFEFTTQKQESDFSSSIHVSSLTLNNFRAYEHLHTVDFCYLTQGPASFSLIYAKNGVGKTSIFDGFEFLFKGEVERINVLEKNNKKTGTSFPILHHLKHTEEESSVSAYLSNGQYLKRKVAKLKMSGDDLGRTRVLKSEGASFIGTKNQQDKRQELILPHDSIDGFTMAKTPEQRYDEWIKHSSLQEESQNFLSKITEQNKLQQEIEKAKSEISDVELRIKELNKSRIAVNEITSLVEQFNTLESEIGFFKGKSLRLDVGDNVQIYDSLINETNSFIHAINNYMDEELNPKKNRLELIKNQGHDYYFKTYMDYLSTDRIIADIKNKVQAKKNLENIRAQKDAVSKSLVESERELETVKNIIMNGGEEVVRKKAKRVIELRNQESYFREKIEQVYDNVMKCDKSLTEINASIKVIENKLIDEEENKTCLNVARNYNSADKSVELINIQLEKLDKELEKLEEALKYYRNQSKELQRINLNDDVSCANIEMLMRCVEFLKGQRITKTISLIHDYEKLNIENVSLNKQIKMNAQKEDDLGRIIKLAEAYVLNHPDISRCPVCGKDYRKFEKLYNTIEVNSNMHQDSLIQDLDKNVSMLEGIAKEYSTEIREIKNEINNKTKEYDDNYNSALKRKNRLLAERLSFTSTIGEYNQSLENARKALKSHGIAFEYDPIIAVQEWIDYNQRELELNKERLLVEADKKNTYESNFRFIEMQLEAAIKERETLETNSNLQKSIAYLNEKSSNWTALDTQIELNNHISKLSIQQNDLSEEMKQYDDISNLDYDYLVSELEQYIQLLNTLRDDAWIYKQYWKEQNGLSLKEEYEHTERIERKLNNERVLLLKIIDENSARYFFDEYRNVIENKKYLKNKLKSYQTQMVQCTEEKNKLKSQLESDLEKYFNQSMMNSVYSKIDPHPEMKSVKYTIEFSEDNKPQLYITASDGETQIRPEWYFSTAQLNTLVFSSFFSKALKSDQNLKTIFVDDPISHFDDMNILGFADLMRCLIMETPFQFIMSTHDRKIYDIMKRKLPPELYNTKFIEL